MIKKTILRELIPIILKQLQDYGYSKEYLNTFNRHLKKVVEYYEKHGTAHYNLKQYEKYLAHIESDYSKKNLPQHLFWSYRKCACFLDEYCRLGCITPQMLTVKKQPELSTVFNQALEKYLTQLKTAIQSSTIVQRCIAIRKYLLYFQNVGRTTFNDVLVTDVQQYFIQLATSISNRTLNQHRLHIRQFHRFLCESEIFTPSWINFLDFKVVVPIKIQGYLTMQEIDNILKQINYETALGKRDYAIISLARTTGLRGGDIVSLKLSGINWVDGVITVIQRKTGVKIMFPLLHETGDALKEYILNSRPNTDCNEIFVRAHAPHTAFKSTSSLDAILIKYEVKANIPKTPWDGKAFHGTRRGLGRNLILAGAAVSDIVQILGQSNLDSSKPYLNLNTPELKECALDFSGIPLKRGVLL